MAASIAAVAALIGLIAPFTKWSPTKKAADAALKSAQAAADAVKVNARSADAAQASAEAASKSADAALHSAEASDRNATDAGQRADQDALSKRYQDAAEQLGHEKAPVRLAGLYSMARLADDWPQQRQTCVDVLCAYLRMPWIASGDGRDESEYQLRRSILTVFKNGLASSEGGPCAWSTISVDFSGAILPDFTFPPIRFGLMANCSGVTFEGDFVIMGLAFDYVSDFANCTFKGKALIGGLKVRPFPVDFSNSTVAASADLKLFVDDIGKGPLCHLDLNNMKVDGSCLIAIFGNELDQGSANINGMKVSSGANVIIQGRSDRETLSSDDHWPTVSTKDWIIAPGAKVDILHTPFQQE